MPYGKENIVKKILIALGNETMIIICEIDRKYL